jgi:hypothetical protein
MASTISDIAAVMEATIVETHYNFRQDLRKDNKYSPLVSNS